MKRLDPRTQEKLNWLCVPFAIVVILVFAGILFDWGLEFLTWAQPAMVACAALVFGGYSVAAIKQKCWGELVCAIVGFVIIFYGLIGLLATWLVTG